MILTSHAIIGVAAASAFPTHPILAFSAALASHYIVDAIPHWEYDLLSSKKDRDNPLNNDLAVVKDFFSDLIRVLFDMCLGIVISFFIFHFLGFNFNSLLILIAGIAGAVAPDILQFVYFRFRREPFKSLYVFHYYIHSRTEKLKKHFIVGIFLQILTVFLIVLLAKYLMNM